MTYALSILWFVWVLQALAAALMARKLGRGVHDPLHGPFSSHTPFAVVIVPFKGIDTDLAGHIRSLCEQHYPDYRVLAVVESEDDPAYSLLRSQIRRYGPGTIQVLVAGKASRDEGQKVHNQRYVLEQLNTRPGELLGPEHGGGLRDEHALVFADSDAVPDQTWLAALVGPLVRQTQIGMTTGYRWLVPEAHGNRSDATLASHIGSLANGAVASLLTRRRYVRAWGGSMAMSVRVARAGRLSERLRGAITDDFPLTHMCHELNLDVYYVKRCLVASPIDFKCADLLNFSRRQYLITRIYAPRLYYYGLAVATLHIFAAWSAILHLILNGVRRPHAGEWIISLVFVVAVHVLNHFRADYRRRSLSRLLPPDALRKLRRTLLLDRWATLGWFTVHWLLIARAAFGRTMTWRGIRYRLDGPNATRRLSD